MIPVSGSIRSVTSPVRPALLGIATFLACFIVLAPVSPARAGSFARPLTVIDDLACGGTITITTAEWKLVFDDAFNGGPAQLHDLSFDPTESDNLATESSGGFYSNGVLFDYDVYLGTNGANQYEYMTTMGTNSSIGSLALSILENTPARVCILQSGHPRLNNGTGPPGDIFPELPFIGFTTQWTIYPTGKVHIDFVTTIEVDGMTVDSGPGGGAKGVDTPGGTTVNAVGETDFRKAQVP